MQEGDMMLQEFTDISKNNSQTLSNKESMEKNEMKLCRDNNLKNNEHCLLQKLIENVDDTQFHADFKLKFLNTKHLSKAILRAVYEDKRKKEHDEYYHVIYKECYDKKILENRPFINFGPGSFRHKYWKTADKIYTHSEGKLWSELRSRNFCESIDYIWDMYSRNQINIENDSIEIAYASHVSEHAYDDDNEFFFKDVHRILKTGGIFRLTAPDIDLGLRAAKNSDYSYYGYSQFLRGGRHRKLALGLPSERLPIEWFVIENCSLLVRKENSTFLTPQECIKFLWSDSDVYKTLDRASRLSDRSLNEKVAAHVNWFNLKKIASMLKNAGFSQIIKSSYGQSVSPVLRDTRYFDNTSPRVSWYIDAIK